MIQAAPSMVLDVHVSVCVQQCGVTPLQQHGAG